MVITGSPRQDTNMRRSTTALTRRSIQKVWEAILWKAYSPGLGDSCARTTSGCLRAKSWVVACRVLLATQCLGGVDLAPPTMAESSFLAFVGDHEGGNSARLPGQASILQARGRMARFKGLLLLKHSQKSESAFRDTKIWSDLGASKSPGPPSRK